MHPLKSLNREVPDFPKPGINFYDITTLLKDPTGFKGVIDGLTDHYRSTPVDVVLGIEARGFIIAPAVAYALGYGFILELDFLKGREKLSGYDAYSLLSY